MIKHIMVTTLLWLTIVATFPLYAQQQRKNTLGILWPKVEENYPGIRARALAVDAAELHERSVNSEMLPQVKAQAQNTYGTFQGSAGAFFPQAGFFNVSGSPAPLGGSSTAANTFGSATIEWELFSFGKLHKQSAAAGSLHRKSVSEKEAYLLDLKKILSERYILLLYNQAKLQWTQRNVDRLDDIRKITAGLSASGLRPAADSLLASSSYVQAIGENDKWTGKSDASLIKLLELYGEQTLDYSESVSRFSNPSAEHVISESTIGVSHPILDALDHQSAYYALAGEAQKSASLPSVRFLGGYAHRGTGIGPNGTVSGSWKDGFSNTTNNFLVGVGITWNLTNLHTNRVKGEQLFKEAQRASLLRSQYQRTIQADLSAWQKEIIQQREQLQKTKLAVQQSQDAYNMYLARYRSGLITLSELLQIRLLLEQAENSHIEASKDYWILLAYQAELTADFDFLFNNL